MTTPTAVRDYLARVRTALADLPDAEIEEILEDVRPHLQEIAGELGEDARVDSMIERLGSPESYAAEIRAAGDYPAPPASPPPAEAKNRPRHPNLVPRIALWSLVGSALFIAALGFGAGMSRRSGLLGFLVVPAVFLVFGAVHVVKHGLGPVKALPEVRAVLGYLRSEDRTDSQRRAMAYLRSLQPAWWLVCTAALALLGVLLVRRSSFAVLVLVALVVVGVVAIVVAPMLAKDRRWLWYSLPVSALAAGALLGGGAHLLDSQSLNGPYGYSSTSYTSNQTADGRPALSYGADNVENIYAFDAQGKPLHDIYLFDENGRPLSLPRYACEPASGGKAARGNDNVYPRPRIDQGTLDDHGNRNGYYGYRAYCQENTETPFAAALPKVPTSKAPAPPSTVSSTPAPPPAPPASPEPPKPSPAPTR
ncbi:DUF1700 domain-containing protein [Amycolatopsis minnesotensis]|uniref:Proline-rich protein n=1 Tax=Amycolatopsis minnesotensis TaxID=337894 RepID=A0ABN2RWU9_9PSEU